MQLYDQFYKRYGVRTPAMLLVPTVTPNDKFEFPKNSVYHYITSDALRDGPDSNDPLYRNIDKRIQVEHVTSLVSNIGDPKRIGIVLNGMMTKFHLNNKRFRMVEDVSNVTDDMSLCVVNYALLNKAYKYIRSSYAEYYEWINIQKAVWDKISKISAKSTRQHFIVTELPAILPSISRLELGSKVINANTIKFFDTPASLFLLEMWKWISEENRESSTIGNLTEEQLRKVNIVYLESGQWSILNLGILNSWRYIKESSEKDQKIKIDPETLQYRVLRHSMSLTELRAKIVVNEIETPLEANDVTTDSDVENQLPEERTVIVTSPMLPTVLDNNTNTDSNIEVPEGVDPITAADSKAKLAEQYLATLHEDLKHLEIVEQKQNIAEAANVTSLIQNTVSGKVEISSFDNNVDVVDTLKARTNELAENGLVTAQQYRRLNTLIDNTKLMVSPDGKTLLKDYVKIDPEVLKIKDVPLIADIPSVIDKSMLKSSLNVIDEKYITEVLPKDTASMVTAIQNAGYLVTKYSTEVVEDYVGAYENHTVQITPIEGVPSTVRFKLPRVNKDGTYISNGIQYRMRKQRGSLPICKIAPDRVGLTSYYGKTFVSKDSKKVNDYSSWLNARIMVKGLDPIDPDISNLLPANVFDNTYPCTKLYSGIAMSFKGFSSQGFDFNFDHKTRLELTDEKTLKSLEVNGRILIATNALDNYLVLDQDGIVYEIEDNKETVRGSLENFLNIQVTNAPLDFINLKIFGKEIPVGLVLGYLYGFDELVNKLQVKYRKVPTGTRVNLDDSEYAVIFKDETICFDKDNRIAALILAGFSSLDKVTKNYTQGTFNNKGVYLNLLDSMALGSRYLREIELIDQMFVDPITLELLKEMNEPTTFRGLLVRSAEMLLNDQHPDMMDMRYMRIKGYERLSGAVYAEMVQALREHKAKGGKATQPVELHPYAVWKRVTQDPSITISIEINPVQDLKETEAVTFGGVGGRMSRAMVKRTRGYHPTDMGVISESTVDSSDVAINTFLSADPKFNSLRGTSDRYEIGKSGITSLLSTAALLSVGSDRDD